MRVTVRGAYTMEGTSKTSGNPFSMCMLVIETQQETVANTKMKRIGFGYDTKDLDMEPEAFVRLTRSGAVCPFQADLVVGSRVGFRGLEAVITEVKPVQVRAAA